MIDAVEIASKHLMQWLREAHAVEIRSVALLSDLAQKARDYRHLRVDVDRHLNETIEHARLIGQCIERRGSLLLSVRSTEKTPEPLPNALTAVCTLASAEISIYRILSVATQVVRDKETEDVCRRILSDELKQQLHLHIEPVTIAYLARTTSEEPEDARPGSARIKVAGGTLSVEGVIAGPLIAHPAVSDDYGPMEWWKLAHVEAGLSLPIGFPTKKVALQALNALLDNPIWDKLTASDDPKQIANALADDISATGLIADLNRVDFDAGGKKRSKKSGKGPWAH